MNKCSACSNPVGPNAVKCPNCGEPTFVHDQLEPMFDLPDLMKWSFGCIVVGFFYFVFGKPGNGFFGMDYIEISFYFSAIGVIGVVSGIFIGAYGIHLTAPKPK